MKTIKKFAIGFIVVLLFYFSFGFFIIQPIGAIPEGATILYFRLGLSTSFISSADGIILDNDEKVSLLARGMVFAEYLETINNRKIVKLPYSKNLYLISTGGVEFEK